MSTSREDVIKRVPFSTLNLNDPFFSSLRGSYCGFDEWFQRKATSHAEAYIAWDRGSTGIIAMLYLKKEDGSDTDVTPPLKGNRLKIGTFKVDFDHHTSLGKRLLAIALRKFARENYCYVYVTMFENSTTSSLENLLGKYGFVAVGKKENEIVLAKKRPKSFSSNYNPYTFFPFVDTNAASNYLLSILPKYHLRLFGEVQLRSEQSIPISDEAPINTIEKIYLSGSSAAQELSSGDHIAIYRTGDGHGPARYRAIISSICTVTDVHHISSFSSKDAFFKFIKNKSVFTKNELDTFWNSKKYPWVVSFLFNFPLTTYPNRDRLLKEGIIEEADRTVCNRISRQNFEKILEIGKANEGYVIN
ncbi:MAG: hypothetical protein LKJ31_06320 [Atopobiaceae bacterium]|jgi:hypothetical protein|nr:hypothetical protein [Atopobiaceae bacterium]